MAVIVAAILQLLCISMRYFSQVLTHLLSKSLSSFNKLVHRFGPCPPHILAVRESLLLKFSVQEQWHRAAACNCRFHLRPDRDTSEVPQHQVFLTLTMPSWPSHQGHLLHLMGCFLCLHSIVLRCHRIHHKHCPEWRLLRQKLLGMAVRENSHKSWC